MIHLLGILVNAAAVAFAIALGIALGIAGAFLALLLWLGRMAERKLLTFEERKGTVRP